MVFADIKIAASRDRLTHLMGLWSKNTRKINKLGHKTTNMRNKAWVKPSLTQKLINLIDQVTFFRDKELNIISEINEIEKKHSFLREHKKLKKPRIYQENCRESVAPEPKRGALWQMIFWLWLFSNNDNNYKKQKLIPN